MTKKYSKGWRKWKQRDITWILLFIFIFCIPLLYQGYLNLYQKNTWVTEYSGNCMIRDIKNGTWINSYFLYQLILSDTQLASLPVFSITNDQFITLWWDGSKEGTLQNCSSQINLSYETESQTIVKISLQ